MQHKLLQGPKIGTIGQRVEHGSPVSDPFHPATEGSALLGFVPRP